MKKALIYSIAIHLIVLLLVIFDLHFSTSHKISPQTTMLVDFVKIAEKSAAPKLSPSPALKEAAKDKNPETIKPAEPDTAKNNVKQKILPKPEKAEQPLKTETTEKNKTETLPAKKPTKKPPQPKKEVTPPKKPKPVPNLINLQKDKKATNKKPKKSFDDLMGEIDAEGTLENNTNETGVNAETVGDVVTASEIDAVRQKIYHCWVVPAGAIGADNLVVDVDMEMAEDGTVVKAEVVDKARISKDEIFRITAESAVRALRDPQCNPLPLPKNKYNQWKNITFSFNPKDMQ